MGRGRDAEAVNVVHKVAAYNGKSIQFTVEMLEDAGRRAAVVTGVPEESAQMDTSAKAAALRKLKKFDAGHVRSLFATRKLAWSTSLLITVWGKSSS